MGDSIVCGSCHGRLYSSNGPLSDVGMAVDLDGRAWKGNRRGFRCLPHGEPSSVTHKQVRSNLQHAPIGQNKSKLGVSFVFDLA